MNNSARLHAREIRIGDLITLWNGLGYRVQKIIPSASGKLIQIETVVEVTTLGGPELGRRFKLGKQAGTMLTVERAC